jgi:hypothetical protein
VNQVSATGTSDRISITESGFNEIARAGRIELAHHFWNEIEDVLNSYVLRSGWDRNSRSSKDKKAHIQEVRKQIDGFLQSLDDVNRKLSGSTGFDPGIALEDQSRFHRAGVEPTQFLAGLQSLGAAYDDDQAEPNKGGRPRDIFLPQFFCELEEIYLKAGGRRTGVTKALDGTRKCPFADFVNAILRFAPAGLGPSSSPAVAIAWERQRRSRKKRLSQLKFHFGMIQAPPA